MTRKGQITDPLVRFEAKFTVDLDTGCWNWQGSKSLKGYGAFWMDTNARSAVPASQAAWMLYRGPIPDGMEMDHACRNTSCVNPAHLEPVTREENLRRRDAGHTHCRRGHEFTEANAAIDKRGRRSCRACIVLGMYRRAGTLYPGESRSLTVDELRTQLAALEAQVAVIKARIAALETDAA